MSRAEPKALTIGDTNRAGDLQITDTAWDGNGTMRVTVRCMIGGRSARTDADQVIAKARRLARRALPYPEKTRSSRLARTWYAQGTEHYTFEVSRLPI